MPFGTLRSKDARRKSRMPAIHAPDDEASSTPAVPALPSPVPEERSSAGFLRPDSAARVKRPSSSYTPTPHASARPEPRRAASTNSSTRIHRTQKYASDPQMRSAYQQHAARPHPPPSPPDDDDEQAAEAPVIGMGSRPMRDRAQSFKQHSRRSVFRPFGHAFSFRTPPDHGSSTPQSRKSDVDGMPTPGRQGNSLGFRPSTSTVGSSRAEDLPPWSSRLSESAARARASAENLAPHSRTADHKSSFFKLSRRKKAEPLFPLPVRVSPPKSPAKYSPNTGDSHSPLPRRSSGDLSAGQHSHINAEDAPNGPLHAMISENFARHGSSGSVRSARSSPPAAGSLYPKVERGRSGTTTSFPGHGPHILHDSGRNSTASTTLGRNSMAGIRSLTSKLRTSDTTRYGTPSSGHPGPSTNTSFALSRETLVIPDRDDGETPGKYFARLEAEYPKRAIALALSKSNDSFSHDTLRSLARTFKFYEEPVDMSLRKFLWEIPLTGEAQQIDRVMSAFSERYHECNPHIFSTSDEANYVAFSLIILHSDLFNPSVKNKMQRHQYQKNTRDVGIPSEVLGYFYDNIAYTEFIHEDADEDDGERRSKSAYRKARKVKARLAAPEQARNDKLDPYEVILDDKVNIETLKPALKNELNLEDTYTYLGTANRFDIPSLRTAFARYGFLQVVSARSRPAAFTAQSTIDNPNEAQAGVVSIKVAKVGLLWRKSPKKRKTRSPWQEWGAILTPSQLFFHRNVSWVKNLMQQLESHQRMGNREMACVFKPPLTELSFESTVATHDSVALQDTSYKRHKHAFVLARRPNIPSGSDHTNYFEETLLAESDADMSDWIAKLNYASTFKTANVRMDSWEVGSRQRANANDRDLEDADGSPKTEERLSNEAVVRVQLAKSKLLDTEEEAKTQIKKLEDNLRIARHLEILAPFMAKTRSELLGFGARLAHNIRWNRFDVHRLKCHREILFKDLQEDESTSSRGISALYTDRGRFSPLTKQGPMIDVIAPSPRSPEIPKFPDHSDAGEVDDGLDAWNGGDMIDEAFATPPETLARFETSRDGQVGLLPIKLNTTSSHSGASTPNPGRRASLASSIGPARPQSADSSGSGPSATEEEVRRGSLTGSEKEAVAAARSSSVSGKGTKLHKSLREARGSFSSHQSRSRARRTVATAGDAPSVSGDDTASIPESEGLARRPGSFTVHGKKASVITLGSEWQQVSTEERLRLRKLALQNEGKRASLVDGTDSSVHFESAYEEEAEAEDKEAVAAAAA